MTARGRLIAANENWRSDQEAEIIATGIPPLNDLEISLLAITPPSVWTFKTPYESGKDKIEL